jgi:large subunit ribosomal protein L10
MPVSKEKKQQIWQDVNSALDAKGSIVFANFHGLTVADTTTLRKHMRTEGVSYLVAKKSIVKKILRERNVSGELPDLVGELAVVSGDDIIAPARETYDFQKKFDGRITLLGGIIDGTYKSKEEVTSLATIPPMPVLRGMFVNVINSPIQRFVIALSEISKKKTA